MKSFGIFACLSERKQCCADWARSYNRTWNWIRGQIVENGDNFIKEKYHPKKIFIEAQCYATGYYEREGFSICSEKFLEDGIPHVQMELML